MEFSARQVAELLKGTVEGDPDVKVSKLSKIEEGLPGTMTFLANPVYTHHIYSTRASIVVVNNDFSPTQTVETTLVRVENAYSAFAELMEIFTRLNTSRKGISEKAHVCVSATVGENVYLGEFVYIGENAVIGNNVTIHPHTSIAENAFIGDNTLIYPNVSVYRDCVIGKNCTIHSGVVIGSDGFGFAPQVDKEYKKIIQAGNVIIEDNVELGANTTIDRATLGSTIIRKGVKLDNLVQVAHNAEIGENTVIAAQSAVAGSTKVGKNCLIAGQVGISGHITIGDNVKIGGQSGIEHSIKDGDFYIGTPALEAGKTRRLYVHWRNFDQLVKKIGLLEKLIKHNKNE